MQPSIHLAIITFIAIILCCENTKGQEKREYKKLLEVAEKHLENGIFTEAIDAFEDALGYINSNGITDAQDISSIYFGLGRAYYYNWQHHEAQLNLENAVKLFEISPTNKKDKISSCYSYLARIHTRKEQHTNALAYNEKNLSLNLDIYGKTHSQTGLAYAVMGITYGRLVNFEKSLECFQKANAIFIPELGKGHRWVITTYENIGRALNRLKRYKESVENYDMAIELGEKHLGRNNLVVAHVFLNAADTYAAIENYNFAERLYNKALKIQLAHYGSKHREIAQNYIAQGNFHMHRGNYRLAKEMFQKVVNDYAKEIEESLSSDSLTTETNVLTKLVEALEGKGHALLLEYKANKELKGLKEATDVFESANQLIEKIRASTLKYEDKIRLTAANHITPRGTVEAWYLMYEAHHDIEHLKKAVAYSERNKIGLLHEVTYRGILSQQGGEISSLMDKEQELKKQASMYRSKSKMRPQGDAEVSQDQQQSLLSINKELDSVHSALLKKFPNYGSLINTLKFSSIKSIQSHLAPNKQLVEYFMADSTTCFVFLVSKYSFHGKLIKVTHLSESIKLFNKSITDKNIKDFKQTSRRLYDNLLLPIKDLILGDELTIIPDKILWEINFDLLLTDENESNDPKKLPYLFKKYAISYLNAMAMIGPYATIPSSNKDKCLAFSYANKGTEGQLSLPALGTDIRPIPGSSAEIKEIAGIVNGDYLYGKKANEKNFKYLAGDYSILHLALHGELNNEKPEDSKLLFAHETDTLEDNILYAHELYWLNLPAKLAVLSACNSGDGPVLAGEGITGFVNAFQIAGTKSLLISRWEVSDGTTPQLMRYFYENLAKGQNKSKALQNAKNAFLADADVFRTHPFYWGGFYLVGDTTPLDIEKSRHIWPILTVLLTILLFGIALLKKKT